MDRKWVCDGLKREIFQAKGTVCAERMLLILEKQIFQLDQMKNGSRGMMLDVYKEEIGEKKEKSRFLIQDYGIQCLF